MENVESGQIEFTKSTNKSPKQAIKSRVWRNKPWSHTAAHGALALKDLLKNPKEKLGRQVQNAMCSKYRCFLAILQEHILAFRSTSAPECLQSRDIISTMLSLEGVLDVATHWFDGAKSLSPSQSCQLQQHDMNLWQDIGQLHLSRGKTHYLCILKVEKEVLRTYGLQLYISFYFHCWNQVIWMPMSLPPFLPLACKNPTSQVFSPLLSPFRENIRDIFCFQQLLLSSDTYVPCAARYVCTKLIVESSYNQTEQ